jgi:hypothetical protein
MLPILAAVTIMANHPKPEPLSKRATRLFNLSNNQLGGVEYPWISNSKVLRFRGDKLYSFDIPTRRETLLPELTHQVMTSPGYIRFVNVSPTGDWIMWGKSGGNTIFASPLNGSKLVQWLGNGGMTLPYWCSNGKQIAQFSFSSTGMDHGAPRIHFDKVEMHSLDTQSPLETIDQLPKGIQELEVLSVVSANEVIARMPDKIESMSSKQSGPNSFTFTSIVMPREVQEISVWNLSQAKPLHHWRVAIPGQAMSVSVSPDGKKAAWITMRSGSLKGSSLWISNIDGTDLHMLGSESTSEKAPLPMTVNWSPNEKLLSYRTSDGFWAVPVT